MIINKNKYYTWIFIISVVLNLISAGYFISKRFFYGNVHGRRSEQQKWETLFSTAADSHEIIFIGTSLTAQFKLRRILNNVHLKNMGFSGLETGGILANFKRIIVRKPPKIFLEAGINDVLNGKSMNKAYDNFVQMCAIAKHTSPATVLYVQSVLPTLNAGLNLKIMAYNSKVASYCKLNHIAYIDMYNSFLMDGALNSLATTDGVHLNAYGYYLWKKQIEQYIGV